VARNRREVSPARCSGVGEAAAAINAPRRELVTLA
jgi:hypothetical protein